MSTFNGTISSNTDDGTWATVGSYFDSTTEGYLGDISGTKYAFWVRFQNVTIARGASISAAILTVTPTADSGGANCVGKIQAVAADSATAPTSQGDANGRSLTTASVSTGVLPTWTDNVPVNLPDVATVIQEIVSRAGWVSGNAICLFVTDNGSSTDNYRSEYSRNTDPAKSATIAITYSILVAIPRTSTPPQRQGLFAFRSPPAGILNMPAPVGIYVPPAAGAALPASPAPQRSGVRAFRPTPPAWPGAASAPPGVPTVGPGVGPSGSAAVTTLGPSGAATIATRGPGGSASVSPVGPGGAV